MLNTVNNYNIILLFQPEPVTRANILKKFMLNYHIMVFKSIHSSSRISHKIVNFNVVLCINLVPFTIKVVYGILHKYIV